MTFLISALNGVLKSSLDPEGQGVFFTRPITSQGGQQHKDVARQDTTPSMMARRSSPYPSSLWKTVIKLLFRLSIQLTAIERTVGIVHVVQLD